MSEILWTVALVIGLFVLGVFAQYWTWARIQESHWNPLLETVTSIYSPIAAIALVFGLATIPFRRRLPEKVVWTVLALQLLFPLGLIMSFLLPSYIRRAAKDRAVLASIAHLPALPLWLVLDMTGKSHETSVVRLVLGLGSVSELPWTIPTAVLLTTFVCFSVIPIWWGFAKRDRAAVSLEASREEHELADSPVEEMPKETDMFHRPTLFGDEDSSEVWPKLPPDDVGSYEQDALGADSVAPSDGEDPDQSRFAPPQRESS